MTNSEFHVNYLQWKYALGLLCFNPMPIYFTTRHPVSPEVVILAQENYLKI